MTKPKYWEEAKKYLTKKDKKLGKLILKYPDYLKSRKDPFFSLCKSIVGQQISVQAANAVWKKFELKSKKIKPENVLKLTTRQLASCGLSRQKITYLKILAKKFESKEIVCVSGSRGVLGKGSYGVVFMAFHAIYNVIALKCMEMVGGEKKIKKFPKV